MCKCVGCGTKLQTNDKELIGYTNSIDNKLCERCFRINNYNEYKFVVKDNNDYINLLKNIGNTNELVVLVVDLFNISYYLNTLNNYLNNDILLVITKRDILPLSCYDKKIEEYFNNYNLNIIDSVIISSNKNYNFDILFNKINKYKKSNNVYVAGFTNAGKSSMINKILYNYSTNKTKITTSNLPSTTLDSIVIDVDRNLTLIDTPGILDDGDIINYIDSSKIKSIIPVREIKPITYQIKDRQFIIIDELAIIEVLNSCNLTIYMSNRLDIDRCYNNVNIPNDFVCKKFNINRECDIVIQGLGFINVKNKSNINVYTYDLVNVYERNSLI